MIGNWGKDFATLGNLGQFNCPTCQHQRPEIAVVQYDYIGVLWLFCFAFNQRFLRVCAECKKGSEVAQSSLGALAENDVIPFMRKYGLFVLFGIIIVFVIANQ